MGVGSPLIGSIKSRSSQKPFSHRYLERNSGKCAVSELLSQFLTYELSSELVTVCFQFRYLNIFLYFLQNSYVFKGKYPSSVFV